MMDATVAINESGDAAEGPWALPDKLNEVPVT